METALLVLFFWTLVAIPVGIVIGRSIRFGNTEAPASLVSVPADSPVWADHQPLGKVARTG